LISPSGLLAIKFVPLQYDYLVNNEISVIESLYQAAPELFIGHCGVYLQLSSVGWPTYFMMCTPLAHGELSTCANPNQREALALRYTFTLIRSLSVMHAQRLIHGDIKKANMLVVSDPHDPTVTVERAIEYVAQRRVGFSLKLMDFDTSQRSNSADNFSVGTGGLRAPELIMQVGCTQAVDIWGYAAVLYDILTGQHWISLPDVESSQSVSTGRVPLRKIHAMQERAFEMACVEQRIGEAPTGSILRYPYYGVDARSCCKLWDVYGGTFTSETPLLLNAHALAGEPPMQPPLQKNGAWDEVLAGCLKFRPQDRFSLLDIVSKVIQFTSGDTHDEYAALISDLSCVTLDDSEASGGSIESGSSHSTSLSDSSSGLSD